MAPPERLAERPGWVGGSLTATQLRALIIGLRETANSSDFRAFSLLEPIRLRPRVKRECRTSGPLLPGASGPQLPRQAVESISAMTPTNAAAETSIGLPRSCQSAARALPVGCRLGLQFCEPIAVILTLPSPAQRSPPGSWLCARLRGRPLHGSGLPGLGRMRPQPVSAHGAAVGTSTTFTPPGGVKRHNSSPSPVFVRTSWKPTRVTFPTRSKTAVSFTSPVAGSTRTSSFS